MNYYAERGPRRNHEPQKRLLEVAGEGASLHFSYLSNTSNLIRSNYHQKATLDNTFVRQFVYARGF